MTGEMRTIQVTEEEYKLLMKLREALQRSDAAAERLLSPQGIKRSAEFGIGAVAGMAAYWLYQELMEEEEEKGAERPAGPPRKPVELRPVAVQKGPPTQSRRRRR